MRAARKRLEKRKMEEDICIKGGWKKLIIYESTSADVITRYTQRTAKMIQNNNKNCEKEKRVEVKKLWWRWRWWWWRRLHKRMMAGRRGAKGVRDFIKGTFIPELLRTCSSTKKQREKEKMKIFRVLQSDGERRQRWKIGEKKMHPDEWRNNVRRRGKGKRKMGEKM